MPQDIDKMMGLTFPTLNRIVPCPACEGSGHKVLTGAIKVIYNPAYCDIPGYKLDVRVEHCIHCGGTGVIENRVINMPEPTLNKKEKQDE